LEKGLREVAGGREGARVRRDLKGEKDRFYGDQNISADNP
jgi:hypothetical protein